MTFIIACGGTAGHVNPGLSIAEELRSRQPDARILFIGAGRDLEKRLVPEAGFELENIKMSGIKRGLSPLAAYHNAKTVLNVALAMRTAAKIMRREQPKAVIGTGGYICYPVIKAAAKQRIPTFIHESNAMPGMTVKKLSGIADKVMITYPGFEEHYKSQERIVVTGTPVRKGFYAETAARAKLGDKPLVVSFWGSLGAERMNAIMADFIERNIAEQGFHHIHATGNSRDLLFWHLKDIGVWKPEPPYADIRDYIDNMPEVMSSADLVLCRAGGITLAELTALGKPGILVPSPYVPDNVQFENAKQLESKGAALLIKESECDGALLYETVLELVNDRERLGDMSGASKSLARPNAASDIADLILSAAS